jgi:hypothetical protein
MRVSRTLLIVVIAAYCSLGSAIIFLPQNSVVEGGKDGIPVIAAAAGCLMGHSSMTAKLFLYEHAASMWPQIAAAITEDSGLVALQGHGMIDKMQTCNGAYESSAYFADFLRPLKGITVIKYVISFGCRTGQTFVEELQAALALDFPGVIVTGPLHPLVMDCGNPKPKGYGRIVANGLAAYQAAGKIWGTMSALYQKNTMTAKLLGENWVLRQAAAAEQKGADAVALTRALATKLATEYTPLWVEFNKECDKVQAYFENGQGWVTVPKGFFFRQVMPKSKKARTRHVQRLQPATDYASAE